MLSLAVGSIQSRTSSEEPLQHRLDEHQVVFSNGTSWHAKNASKDLSSMSSIQIRYIAFVTATLRSFPQSPNTFDSFSSIWIDPPLVSRAAFETSSSSISSIRIGLILSHGLYSMLLSASLPSGCFSLRSWMVSLFSGSIPPRMLLVITLTALLTSPFSLFSLNNFDDVSMSLLSGFESLDWMTFASPNRSEKSPRFHIFNRLSRAFVWSWVGFWRSRAGMIDMAFIETVPSGLRSVQAFINRVNSLMKSLSAPPLGKLNKFHRQNRIFP